MSRSTARANSPFTTALLKLLGTPGQSVTDDMEALRDFAGRQGMKLTSLELAAGFDFGDGLNWHDSDGLFLNCGFQVTYILSSIDYRPGQFNA